jgi:NitT/TauT family transport system substrate-binding protein
MSPAPANVSVTCHQRRARPARIVSAAIGALAVAALAAGCQAAGAQSASPEGTVTLTVAATPGIDDAPLYLAVKNGLFTSAGLDVRIHSYQSVRQELQALINGQADVAAGDYADFFYAQATSRADLRVVADGYHAAPGVMEVLTLPNSGITTPQDLEGKTIGTTEPQLMPVQPAQKDVPYSLETVATQSVLDNDGVNPAQLPADRQVKWRPMPSANLINALANRQVNAILIQEPYIYEAESKLGAIEVLDSCSGATASLPLSGYFALGSFAHKNPDALQDFRSALQRAQAAAVQPGPVEAVLAQHSGMPMETASLVTIGAYPTSLDAASLQRVADLMFSFNVLGRTLDVAGMTGP